MLAFVLQREWRGQCIIPPPMFFVSSLLSLFLSRRFSAISNPCTDVILPVYLVLKQRGQRLSPPITYTSSARLT